MISAQQIKPETDVLCAKDVLLATVDHMEGKDTIKLKKDKTGQHHFIPLSWVSRVDSKVHLNRTREQAEKEWRVAKPTEKATAGAEKTTGVTETVATDRAANEGMKAAAEPTKGTNACCNTDAKTSDHKASVSDSKASMSDSKASMSDSKASVSDSKASVSDSKASVSDSKASVSNGKVVMSGNKAGMNTGKPTLEKSGNKAENLATAAKNAKATPMKDTGRHAGH